jgi:hypothetical protein
MPPLTSERPEVVWGTGHVSATSESIVIDGITGGTIVNLNPLNRADPSGV